MAILLCFQLVTTAQDRQVAQSTTGAGLSATATTAEPVALPSTPVPLAGAWMEVRLLNGTGRCSGRVEVLVQGTWGTVCDDLWDLAEATVVCRQLQCGQALAAPTGAHFGAGSGKVLLDDMQCVGSERHLGQCMHGDQPRHNCGHLEDASVICTGDALFATIAMTEAVTLPFTPMPPAGAHFGAGSGKVLLDDMKCVGNESHLGQCMHADRARHNCGHLEDASVICAEANIVCRQLECGWAISAPGEAHFGEGSGRIFLDNVHCRGDEQHLEECSHTGWFTHNCAHGEDASVICSGDWPELRLVGGSGRCSGHVEILHQGTWGTVCDDLWDLNEAEAVCRQLGCGRAVSALGKAHFGPGSGDIFLDNLQCTGVERYLGQCAHSGWSEHNCGHHEDASVICSGSSTASQDHIKGRGSNSCGGVTSSLSGSFSSPQYPENYPTDIQCVWEIHVDTKFRIELIIPSLKLEDILGCPYDSVEIFNGPRIASLSMGKFCAPETVIFFSSSHIMTVVFQSDSMKTDTGFYALFNAIPQGEKESEDGPELWLVGGSGQCSGPVEVLHKGSWGTVCGDLWDLNEAEVVCQQLGCDWAIAAPRKAHFGPGPGDILLDNIQCSGSENHLGQCPSSGWSDHKLQPP
ncbi:hypothetical protein H8959_011364 [Pygathrix nigripes]